MASKPVCMYELESEENRYFSPFCWAARFALIHKGLKVKTVPWHFKEQEKIAFSNQGLVGYVALRGHVCWTYQICILPACVKNGAGEAGCAAL